MAFGTTLTITVNSVDKVLNRINQDNYGSEYSLLSDTDSWNLKIRHSTDSVDSDGMTMLRHNFYLEHITYATSSTPMYKETVTATFRAGKYDGTTQVGYDVKAVLAYLAASSYAAVDDLIVGLN
jgi:hypothetical protein